jgi:hypothetical protein
MVVSEAGMLTNACAFLNIGHPVCAWATYRGALVPPPNEPGFISLWAASHLKAGNTEWLQTELELEGTRQRDGSTRVSRLRGLYCFGDKGSAEKALSWGMAHCRPELFADLHVSGGLDLDQRMDANWITHAKCPNLPKDWMSKYWAGEPYPNASPLWEYLAASNAYVLGTDLREKAYHLLKRKFPRSIALLETARLANWIGSDLGSITCYLSAPAESEYIEGSYLLNMKEAGDSEVIEKIDRLRKSGHPIRIQDFTEEVGFVTPDFGPFGFTVLKKDYPYIQSV